MEYTRGLTKKAKIQDDLNNIIQGEAKFSSEKASSSTPTEFLRTPPRGPLEEHDIPSWEIYPNSSDDPEPLEVDATVEQKEDHL